MSDLSTQQTVAVRRLKLFQRLELEQGQVATKDFDLPKRAFAWYDTDASDKVVTLGKYMIGIGYGCRDIHSPAPLQLFRQ